MALPDGVQYGQVKWQGITAAADGEDEDGNPDAVPVSGSVTFRLAADFLLSPGGVNPVTVFTPPVTYQMTDGVLRDSQGRSLITLVATDSPGLTPTSTPDKPLTWTADYRLDGGISRGSFSFELPANTVVDLTTVSPVAASGGTQIIQGPKGDPGGILTAAQLSQTAELQAAFGLYWNARDHGIVGDGVANDGPAIVAAATALSNAGGGVLFFPAGAYKFGSILLSGVSNVELRGVGDATWFQSTYLSSDNADAIAWRGDRIAFRSIKLEAMNKLGAPQAGFSNYELLRIGGTVSQFRDGVTVENCTFVDGGGMNAYCTRNVVIRNNRYTFSHGNSFGAVNVVENVIIDGNYAYSGNDDMIAVTCDSTAAVAGGTRRVTVTNNIVDTGDAKGICFSGVDGGVISGNHVRNTFAMGIVAFQDGTFNLQPSNRVIISDNVVRQAGYCFGADRLHATTTAGVAHGIMAAGTTTTNQVKIVDNLILDAYDRGIQVNNGSEIDIVGNTIVEAGGVGINVGNPGATNFTTCTGVAIRGNTLRETVTGIALGSITNVTVVGNSIRSYLNGATPSRRGIFYAYLKNGLIAENVIVNDDGGQETILESPVSSANMRFFGNVEVADPTAVDIGNVFTIGNQRLSFGTAAPTAGAWGAGDLRINSNPSSGSAPWAWICRTAGSPGTWQALTPVNWLGTSNTFQGTQTFDNVTATGNALLGGVTKLVGFYGATGVAQQTATAAATDAATTQALANGLRTALIALGLLKS